MSSGDLRQSDPHFCREAPSEIPRRISLSTCGRGLARATSGDLQDHIKPASLEMFSSVTHQHLEMFQLPSFFELFRLASSWFMLSLLNLGDEDSSGGTIVIVGTGPDGSSRVDFRSSWRQISFRAESQSDVITAKRKELNSPLRV